MEKALEAPLTMSQMLSFFEKMMEKNAVQTKEMIQTIVSEIRKPPVDPVREVTKKREKESKEKNEKEYWEKNLWKLLNCKHEREDGTCVVGWATQSDGKERGYCPNCNNGIGPELAMTYPERAEEMTALYQEMRRRPRGRKENVRYVA